MKERRRKEERKNYAYSSMRERKREREREVCDKDNSERGKRDEMNYREGNRAEEEEE